MRQSELFVKTRREVPQDEVAKNAQLLIRAGFVHKEMAGVYSYLPLGWRVLNRLNAILREAMAGLGAVEVHLSALQASEPWERSGRWSDQAADFWFKTKLKNGAFLGLGATHEEPLTALMRGHLNSYRDLPIAVYQIQTKFRNEDRAKSGLLRCREFLMKDLYSFHRDQAELDDFHQRVVEVYQSIFRQVGLGDRTLPCFAGGGSFSSGSLEFQTLCAAGEDTVYLSAARDFAINAEICTDEVLENFARRRSDLSPHRAIEVGNLFKLGTRFSESLELSYRDQQSRRQWVSMGSYGLGPTRLLGAVAEVLSDDRGLVWPLKVAPFTVHLLSLKTDAEEVFKTARTLYNKLRRDQRTVLWDDRGLSAGEQFADSDLLGLPYRLIVGRETIRTGRFELVSRSSGERRFVNGEELDHFLEQHDE